MPGGGAPGRFAAAQAVRAQQRTSEVAVHTLPGLRAGLSVNPSDSLARGGRSAEVLKTVRRQRQDQMDEAGKSFGGGGGGGVCGHLLCGVIQTVWGRAILCV